MFKWSGLFLVLSLCLAPLLRAAGPDKQHNDAFVPGSSDENRIAKEVRHQLVMLPYYSVFDDLAFRWTAQPSPCLAR